MICLDEQGRRIETVEELLKKYPNAKVEHDVTARILVKNSDGTVSYKDTQVTRVGIRNGEN